jgi:DNA-binding NtrC family response regulator
MSKPSARQPSLALVVDDDLDLVEILKAALVEEADFRVLTAAVPDLVVPLVEAAPPASWCSTLPCLDRVAEGAHLTALRQHPHFRMLPVLIVSAMPDAQSWATCIHDPWVEFLAKPVDLETLLKQVQALVERQQQEGAHEAPPDTP